MRPCAGGTDRGGIVLGWLLKIVLVLAVVGVVAYDGVAIAYAKVAASDDARAIARAAADPMIMQHAQASRGLEMALEVAQERGVILGKGDVVISADGSITVHVHRNATTLLTYRIGPLAHYAVIDETYTTPATQ